MTTRKRGASGVCENVVYIANARSDHALIASPQVSMVTLSKSNVIACRATKFWLSRYAGSNSAGMYQPRAALSGISGGSLTSHSANDSQDRCLTAVTIAGLTVPNETIICQRRAGLHGR